ncbi:ABC transporter ATP-binding protein [Microbacterium amylolyticum]|uniref:ABC-2 type transport system ATP-binding protein n=1 Tax=Microbacterium amylolyticum TaxID=936337 RepID=A0ABS4ZET4_9MICO|nr:ABC transporter ATP-binding protein [Microbacterium amylolyticum]MBP2435807.1 ABC-2 type transport system ATP-binding protein [Microbacterium amylolyticum]
MIPAIEVQGLTRSYRGRPVLRGVDLAVREGETLGILGHNGAGKTTLVETIGGLRKPTSGSVRVLGLDPIADRDRVRGVLGMQLQNSMLHHALSVRENLRLHRSFYRSGEDPDALIERLGLTAVRGTHAQRLSGGQQQRLSVGVALIGRPRVLILDELTTGLDPEGRRGIWRLIEQLQADGVTILLVSHSMDEVARLCRRVIMLDAGRILTEGSPEALREQTGAEDLEEAFLALRQGTRDTGETS